MFTGITEEIGTVAAAAANRLVINAGKVLQNTECGHSIAVNGVCLTVTAFDSRSFTVDLMPETLRRTNLGRLRPGSRVNLERALALGGQVGGHLVQGHVDDTGTVAALSPEGEALLASYAAPPEIMRYIVPRGFIAVDGVSLTVVAKDGGSFRVSLVDFTRRRTTLGSRRLGDMVNLEVDMIAKYVSQFMQTPAGGVTSALLREHGFITGEGD